MVSFPDVLVISVLALLLFGPERLPKVMRQAGRLMREMQNTSQAFIAEMERAADIQEAAETEAEPADSSEGKDTGI
jgi:sec-independent protein translocase protein TatB